ncbi:MAG: NAD(P)H-dependent oxidoreductase subunit E [Burkholderiaceae bacterium]|nr:NAD(P)H-dependent oxidoreductase subunit E [Burkholderiaceae bacterium]
MSSAAAPHETAVTDDAVAHTLAAHGCRRDRLVQILREVQVQSHWLPRHVLARVAAGVGLTPAIVEGVASFYRFLHLQPVGRLHLLFSDNVTDRHAGSHELAAELCRRLGVRVGEVAADGSVSVGFTSCTGLPDQGPALLVNHHQVLTRMDFDRVAQLADLVRAQVPATQWPAEWQRVDDNVQRADVLLGSAPQQGAALRATLARGNLATLEQIVASGLRGRGGAGFATGDKWTRAREAPLPEGGARFVVCNADEGEPGTFKDRVLLARRAHTLVEGMTVAARLLGARQGLVYLRGEYRFMLEALHAVLARRRAAGLLGARILGVTGFDFDIDIHLGAGAYVCGEESALLESLEGKRGVPRIRPPYPTVAGYLGQPTVVNNVETFCAAALIAERGSTWWRGIGTTRSSGTKIHSVSGDVERPGVYEFPFGVTVGEILTAAGASRTQAVQVGGPSGVTLAPHEFGQRLGFEDLPTAGAFTVFDDRRDMFEVARGYSRFFAHESCGFCTPCRVGTELIVRRMDKLAAGYGSGIDEAELRELEALLHGATHCGLGATAANPLRDTLARFPAAYRQRLTQPRFVPAFDLDAELESARRATGRDDAGAHLERIG